MTPQKLLAFYERGVLVAHEAAWRLCLLATEFDPTTFVEQVPPEVMASIRERAAVIPHTDELIRVGSYCGTEPPNPIETAAREKAETERYVAGLRTWKAYFESVERVSSPTGERP